MLITIIVVISVLVGALALMIAVNAQIRGEPKAKDLSCRLGFHPSTAFEGNDYQGHLICKVCGHKEHVNPYM